MFEMAEEKCQECERLNEIEKQAHRDLTFHRPFFHSGHRPPSRWSKADKDARNSLERAYNLAKANFELHRATHLENCDAATVVRNINIVQRKGRLTP